MDLTLYCNSKNNPFWFTDLKLMQILIQKYVWAGPKSCSVKKKFCGKWACTKPYFYKQYFISSSYISSYSCWSFLWFQPPLFRPLAAPLNNVKLRVFTRYFYSDMANVPPLTYTLAEDLYFLNWMLDFCF